MVEIGREGFCLICRRLGFSQPNWMDRGGDETLRQIMRIRGFGPMDLSPAELINEFDPRQSLIYHSKPE